MCEMRADKVGYAPWMLVEARRVMACAGCMRSRSGRRHCTDLGKASEGQHVRC